MVKCNYCGYEAEENEKFCKNCGANLTEQYHAPEEKPVVATINGEPVVVNTTQTTNTKSNKTLVTVGIIVAIVMALFICLLVVVAFTSDDYSNSSNDNTNIINNNSNDSIDIPNTTTPTNEVKFNGYVIDVPTDYTVEDSDNQLQLTHSSNQWRASINVVNADFDAIVTQSSTLKNYYENLGYTIGDIEFKTYSGVDVLTLEASLGDESAVLGIMKADSDNVFAIGIDSIRSGYDYAALETTIGILKNAKVDLNSSSYSSDVTGTDTFGSLFK